MTIRLTPGTREAGETKVFHVVGADLDTTTQELTLICRDGRVCLGLVGSWEVSIRASSLALMSCDEVARIHDGGGLVTVN